MWVGDGCGVVRWCGVLRLVLPGSRLPWLACSCEQGWCRLWSSGGVLSRLVAGAGCWVATFLFARCWWWWCDWTCWCQVCGGVGGSGPAGVLPRSSWDFSSSCGPNCCGCSGRGVRWLCWWLCFALVPRSGLVLVVSCRLCWLRGGGLLPLFQVCDRVPGRGFPLLLFWAGGLCLSPPFLAEGLGASLQCWVVSRQSWRGSWVQFPAFPGRGVV